MDPVQDFLDQTEYDLIILGTGITESILSGAAARIGKKVLHLDASANYGGTLASYSLESIQLRFAQSAPGAAVAPIDEAQVEKLKAQGLAALPSGYDNVIPSWSNAKAADVPQEKAEVLGNARDLKKYCFDSVPRLLWSRSPSIDVLIKAGAARYLEFKCVEHTYMWLNGEIHLVPCSKGEIFKSKAIGLLDKRNLMKFIMGIAKPDESEKQLQEQELVEWGERPFNQYLAFKKLSDTLQSFLLYTIAMVRSNDEATMPNTKKGLELIGKFLRSMGVYGNTPWIYPLYGISEITQAFCRFSAVYGATFVLHRHAKYILVDDETKSKYRGIQCSVGQNLTSKHLVANADHVPFLKPAGTSRSFTSRAVCVTNVSLDAQATDNFLFIVVPPDTYPGHKSAIYILQTDSTLCTSPAGKLTVNIWTEGSSVSQDAIAFLIKKFGGEGPVTPILWTCSYDVDRREVDSNKVPEGVHVVSDPDASLDLEGAVQEARNIFNQIFPGEEYIPEVPSPDDITWDDESDPAADHSVTSTASPADLD